jgi:4-hydroxy-3-polyprenylbenzoate decarboxylase
MRIVVGMTGASGAIFGVRSLQVLKSLGVETHLVMTPWAKTTLAHETDFSTAEVEALATVVHHSENQAAEISSGSFQTDGMLIAPCSMKTLAAIRTGYSATLVCRAADVILKERRKLVLVARESPLSQIHLENMLALTQMGAIVCPPVPTFYNKPDSIEALVNGIVMRVLDQLGLAMPDVPRWSGFGVHGGQA